MKSFKSFIHAVRCFKRSFRSKKLDTLLTDNLSSDYDVQNILRKETQRQITGLELIASENFTSKSVLQANGTIFTNKYSEGYPHKRYYGGNEYIDQLEELCQERALKAFDLDKKEWGVNVQSYSGSTANFAVYTGLLKPGQRIMGLDLPSGGHLTHGYATPTKKISNSAIYFDSKPYIVGKDFLIDFDELERRAEEFKPHLIIVGASAYPRDFDYKRFREIADKHGAYLMADIAHISGLVASKLLKSPFKYCDVVTTTTHKTLRGPRAALIFYKNHLKEQIDFAVFPSSQGGPHNNTISAVAVALKQVNTPEFVDYSMQVILNAKLLAKALQKHGFEIITGGTDNHIVLVNLKNKGIAGSKFEKLAEMCNVSVNKNTIATDKSALNPSGIRLGTPAMTSRGFVEKDFQFVANILNDICNLVIKIQKHSPSTKLVDFMKTAESYIMDIHIIEHNVGSYCSQFQLPQ
jgi:glycine hydroxymethyltransferase